jgi:hypothetical protein
MTPKEKAEELVDKMKYPLNGVYIISHVANELALIAVDEIIKYTKEMIMIYDLSFDMSDSYWIQVKHEIEKL